MHVCRSANVRLCVQVYVKGVALTHLHIPRKVVEHNRLDGKCLSKVDRVGQLQ